MPADKPTKLSRIKLKTWPRQTVPMISKHSVHLTPLPFGIRTWLWRYTHLLLLISMLWHRQAIFVLKGDKLFSSAECRIRTQGLRHLFVSRLNACWQTDWAIQDQAKEPRTRQPVPMISKHSAHPASMPVGFRTWLWRYTYLLLMHAHMHACIHAYMHTHIHNCCQFRCSGTGKGFPNRRRQVVFLCWRQDSNAEGLRHLFASRLNACWQTDWAIEN